MGRTYSVPRSVKGEGRILYIFSIKSLITTAIGAACGIPFYLVFSMIGMGVIGFISIGICAVIGYFVGVMTIPDSPLFGNLRKAGGESVSDILIRTAAFMRKKKIYIYRMKKSVANKDVSTREEDKLEESEVKDNDTLEENKGEVL